MKILIKLSMALLVSVALWGCSQGNSAAPPAIDPATGKHTIGWFDVGTGGLHPSAFFADRSACKGCHGDNLDGGISRVSCSPGPNNIGCHPKFPHQADFANPINHGASAKGQATPTGIFGMAHCQKCHGQDFKGELGPSCIECHQKTGSNPNTNAPHAGYWAKSFGRHSKTDESNAAVCVQCHAGGNNSKPPLVPAPAGTAPGCFNGTLCHNDVSAHTLPFTNPADHGAAIKANGWSYCANCHATTLPGEYKRFNVPRGALTSGCETCHNRPYIAHPQMWLPGRGGGTPTTVGGTDAVNNTSHINVPADKIITSCTLCHGIIVPSANPVVPSCASAPGQSIDGIRCHFRSPVDSTGQSNGCTSCHVYTSTNFSNFSTNKHAKHINAINLYWPDLIPPCITCHGNNLGRGATHANGTVNVNVLARFGSTAAYDPSTKSCANVTCHQGNTTPAWTSSGPGLGCTTCHTSPPDTGRHTKHFAAILNIKCDSCHNDGPGVPTHMTQNPVVVGTPLPAKYNENGATAMYNPSTGKCFNNLCHGGQPTDISHALDFPAWKSSDAFDRNECARCHLTPTALDDPGQTPQEYSGRYIGPFSGNVPIDSTYGTNNLHFSHLNRLSAMGPPSKICLKCHAISGPHYGNIVNGRGDLVPGFAAGTIRGPGITSYTFNGGSPPTSSCFTIPYNSEGTGCHFNNTVAKSWY